MTVQRDEWVVIVDTAPPNDADRKFQRWQLDNPEWRADLKDDDMLIDTIRGPDGQTLRRYRVRPWTPTR